MGKLFLRYRTLTTIAVVCFLIAVPLMYFTQPSMYQKEVHFRILKTTNGDSEKMMVAGLVSQEDTSANSMPEVVALVHGYDFTTRLADRLARSENYHKLDFSSPESRDSWFESSQKSCKSTECRVSMLRGQLLELYSLSPDSVTGRLNLKITTRNSATTLEVLSAFQDTIREVRLRSASEAVNIQIRQLQELLQKSKSDLEAKGGFEKVTSAEFMDALIAQQKEKIRTISSNLVSDDHKAHYKHIRLKENILSSDAAIGGGRKLGYEHFAKISRRIAELQQNIASINSTPQASRTVTDELILQKLTQELNENEQQLNQFGAAARSVVADDTFINNEKNSKNNLELDYRVSNAQRERLKIDYASAMKELDKLYERKASLEHEMTTLRPDVEYVQLLESKLVTLKFKLSALTPDVAFEPYGSEVTFIKRNSIIKIALFAFFFVGFFLFCACLGMYLFDDRIFDELEVERCIVELPVVGHAPYFE